MRPRIEIAEVDSFRLTLTREALEETVAGLSSELSLSLEPAGAEMVLTRAGGECTLRFAPLGKELALVEIRIRGDEGGAFFTRVLARLLAEHEGDLEARLVWNAVERNTHGTHARVRFRRGRPVPPGAPGPGNALHAAALAGGDAELSPSREGAAEPPGQLAADEDEVRRLLERARAQWAEYQRLKAARGG